MLKKDFQGPVMETREGQNWELWQGDSLDVLRSLPTGSVHCCVTSPPYWGLRDYGLPPSVWDGTSECDHEWQEDSCTLCGAWRGQLGLEPSVDRYVAHLVQVFREVRRTLRDDGTLWLNLGDSYAGSWGNYSPRMKGPSENWKSGRIRRTAYEDRSWRPANSLPQKGLKTKDLIGVPWRVALSLQADGWYLRSDIVWEKPNCMPESVRDRPTRSHEYMFLLSKSERYYYDAEAIGEPVTSESAARLGRKWQGDTQRGYRSGARQNHFDRYMGSERAKVQTRRNRRTVWHIASKSFRGAHFAVFPPALVEPCLLAGTSERGCCPVCGAPWRRASGDGKRQAGDGWEATCSCSGRETERCRVLDPFTGSGTTGVVALGKGRRFLGIEMKPDYCSIAEGRLREAAIQVAQTSLECPAGVQ
jgi:DNA modification methylase